MNNRQIQQELDFLRGTIGRLSRITEALESSPLIKKLLAPKVEPKPVSDPANVAQRIVPLEEMERRAILEAVALTGSLTDAAKLLGVGKTTIYRKVRDYERAEVA